MQGKRHLNLVVGVDDTGGEGQEVLSRSVDQHRQTMMAAVMHEDDLDPFRKDWAAMVEPLRRRFGVTEFHAAELWGGKLLNAQQNKAAKQDAEEVILTAFEAASKLCLKHTIAFVVQTVHSETMSTFVAELNKPWPNDTLATSLACELAASKSGRKLSALLLLSRQVLAAARRVANAATVDASSLDIDARWEIDQSNGLQELSRDMQSFMSIGFGSASFNVLSSDQSALVQVADFGAYILNRHMYYVANRSPTEAAEIRPSKGFERAKRLLKRTETMVRLVINVPHIALSDHDVHADRYDALQDVHRNAMGMEPLNFKKPSLHN